MTDEQKAQLQKIIDHLTVAIAQFAGKPQEKILRRAQNEVIGVLYPIEIKEK